MKAFEYIILGHSENKKTTEFLQGLQITLAKNEQAVLLKAAQEIPPSYKDKLDQVEIAIRPF